MSETVDSKVVEMRFDNREFEKNVSTSMSTLEKLRQALKFNDASKGFESIERAAGNTDISALSKAADEVGIRFNGMQVAAVTAISNIVTSAMNAGERLVKSLSVDNISAGWQKFAEETTSVGTLSAQGYDMDTVTEQLKRLNWYTDETSYNFTSMVSNISKFTATGKGLKDSVTAMEGIANWAALSGQNASVASRAMYQLSQAMGAGTMRLIDWKSIQNMSMDTDEFRQKALDAGVALGTLKKNADGTYTSLKATSKAGQAAFSKSQFADYLTAGKWFTSDVMMKVYKDYSAAVNDIYEYADEKGITASKAIEELGGKVDEFGLKAFRAAQEARTWGDTVNAVKDAVSTGWMNTFENIFGNYEEAKTLWTDLANELYDVFAEGGNQRNEMLSSWKEQGGRDNLLEAFWNSFYALTDIIAVVKKSFHDIFPEITAKRLLHITREVLNFTAALRLNKNETQTVSAILKGIFSILDIGVKTISSVLSGFLPLIDAFDRFLNDTDNGVVKLSEFASAIHDTLVEMGVFEEITRRTASVVAILIGYFKRLLTNNIKDFFVGFSKNGSVLSGILYALAGNVGNLIRMIFDLASAITGIDLSGIRDTALRKFADVVISVENTVSSIDISYLQKIGSGIKNFFTGFAGALKNLGSSDTGAGTFIQNIREYFSGIGNVFGSPDFETVWGFIKTGGLAYIVYSLNSFVESVGSIGTGLLFSGELQESITNALDMFGQVRVNTIKSIAVSIGIIAASIVAISMLDTDKLALAVVGIGGAIMGLLAILNKMMSVSAIDDLGTYSALSFLMLSLSAAIMSLSVAMRIIGGMDVFDIVKGLIALSVVMKGFTTAVDKLGAIGVPGEILKAAAAFTIMAFALNLLIPPMLVFGNMPVTGIGTAVLALGSFVGLLALITQELSANIAGVGSFAIMAASLDLLIPPLVVFGNMPVDGIGRAVLALGSFVGLLALITRELGANIAGSASFAIMAASLNLLIPPLVTFSMLPLDTMGTALIEIAGFIGALAVIINVMNTGLAGAGALLAVSAALSMFIPTLALLGQLNMEQLENALLGAGGAVLAMIAAFMAFSAVAAVITPSIPAILGLSAAILALSIGLNLLTAIDITAGLMKVIGALDAALPSIVDLVFDTLMAILRDLKLFGAEIVELVVDIVLDIVLALGKKVGDFVQALVEFVILAVDGLADSLVDPENAARMREAIDHFVYNMIDAIKVFLGINSPSTVFEWIARMCVEGFTGGFMASFRNDLNRYRELGKQMISEWADGFRANYEAGWQAITDFVNGAKEKIKQTGSDIIEGLSDGMEMFKDDPAGFLKGYGEYLIGTFNKSVGVASPSKKMMRSGEYIIGGLVEGLENNSDAAADSMTRLGETTINAFNDEMGIHSNSDEMIESGEYIVGGAVEGVENKKSLLERGMELLGLDGLNKFKESVNYENGYNASLSFLQGTNDATKAMDLYHKDMYTYDSKVREYKQRIQELDRRIMQYQSTGNPFYNKLISERMQLQNALNALIKPQKPSEKEEEEENVEKEIENTLTTSGGEAAEKAAKKTAQKFLASFKMPDGSLFYHEFSNWDAYVKAGQTPGGFADVAKKAWENVFDPKPSAFQSWDTDIVKAQLDAATEAYTEFYKEFKEGVISAGEYYKKYTKLMKQNTNIQVDLLKNVHEVMVSYVKDDLEKAVETFEDAVEDIQSKIDDMAENLSVSWSDIFTFTTSDIKEQREKYVETISTALDDLFSGAVDSYNTAEENALKFSLKMSGTLEDAFTIKTNKDVYDEEVKKRQDRIDDLTKSLERSKAVYGENTLEAQRLQRQIDAETAALEKYKDTYEKDKKNGKKDDNVAEVLFGEQLEEDTENINKYIEKIQKLKTRGISSSLLSTIASMDKKDGEAVVDYLLGKSEYEWAALMEKWDNKVEASDTLGKEFFGDTANNPRDELNEDIRLLNEYEEQLRKFTESYYDEDLIKMIAGKSREDGLAYLKMLNNMSGEQIDQFLKDYHDTVEREKALGGELFGNVEDDIQMQVSVDTAFKAAADNEEFYDTYAEFMELYGDQMEDSFKEYLSGLSPKEATFVMRYFIDEGEQEFLKLNGAYKRAADSAKKSAEDFYSGELEDATNKYVTETAAIIGTLPKSARQTGVDTVRSLAEGISSETESTLSIIDESMAKIDERIKSHMNSMAYFSPMTQQLLSSLNSVAWAVSDIGNDANAVYKNTGSISKGISSSIEKSSKGTPTVSLVLSADPKSIESSMENSKWLNSVVSNDLSIKIDSVDSYSKSAFANIEQKLDSIYTILGSTANIVEGIPSEVNGGFNSLGDALSSTTISIDPVRTAEVLAGPMDKILGRMTLHKQRGG